MSRILVVASAKGGVGKTTVALHTAHAMAKAGLRVLLVDTDPQGAIGLSLSHRLSSQVGLAEVLAGTHRLNDVAVTTRVPGFSLLPAGQVSPMEIDGLTRAVGSGERFARLFTQCVAAGPNEMGRFAEVRSAFDVLVVDTPAGLGGITAGVMRAGRYLPQHGPGLSVLSPIQAEPIALRSVTQTIEMVRALRVEGARVELIGFVLTMLQLRDANSMAVAQEVWGMFPDRLLFDASVPRDPVFLEATAAGVPVSLLRSPAPPVAHVFDVVASEVITRMGIAPGRGGARGPQPFLD